MMARLFRIIRSFLRLRLGLPPPLVEQEVIGHTLYTRAGTIRLESDYDDAWFLACAVHATIVFDIGANVGYDTLLAFLAGDVAQVILVEPNPAALSVAAENLIRNGMSAKARFVAAFAGQTPGAIVRFWTIGTGAAGSIYPSHAVSASKAGKSLKVLTTSVDALCEHYAMIPDLIKVDVEGAEYGVLLGSTVCASHQKTRYLVEMHSNPEMSMMCNAKDVLSWCDAVGYRAWYLKEKTLVERAEQIQHRGRCHLLLQPSVWPFPAWLQHIEQGAGLDSVAALYPSGD